jgi:tetratricopeptide (TPR) repeat protein
VAFVGLTGVVLVKAIRRSHGPDRLLVGAVGGAWVAYQVQSLVSIDTAPLAVLHWVLAGLIVAAASAPTVGVHRPHRPWGRIEAVVTTAVIGAVCLALVTPLRADVAARRALRLSALGEHADAEASFERALRLDPWEPSYPLALARQRVARGDLAAALHAYNVAASRQPRGVAQTLEQASVADRAGRTTTARLEFRRAIELDPHSPLIRVYVARHYLKYHRPGQAVPLLEQAVDMAPRESWMRLLERARASAAERQSRTGSA